MSSVVRPYHLGQVAFMLSKAKQTYLDWGRGTGKSTVLAYRMKDFVYELPRAKIAVPGETYKQLLTRTLPGTIEGLELLGFKKNLHYFVGTRPPRHWKFQEAFQPPLDYEGVITFFNGTTFQMISLETDSGGRGPNFDGVIGDEAGLMDPTRLSNNVLASNRGNMDRYRDHWLHHSLLFASSTPQTIKGRWFLNQKQIAIDQPGEVLYLQVPSTMNAHNLGPEFFKTCRRLMTEMQYNAEILCIRPERVENGFYPNFSEAIHTYDASNINYLFGLEGDVERLKVNDCRTDSDLRADRPIDIACDWGVTINCMVCGQDEQLGNQYNLINGLFVKSPFTLKELGHKFCDYYSSHLRKEVNFFYDHTAIYRDASRRSSFADDMTRVLEGRGWKVNRHYVGQAPGHDAKFQFWAEVHKEDQSTKLPRVRYNKNNCVQLITATQQAGAIDGPNGIQKDKRPERRENTIQEEATHFTDAKDTLVFHKFKERLGFGTGYVF